MGQRRLVAVARRGIQVPASDGPGRAAGAGDEARARARPRRRPVRGLRRRPRSPDRFSSGTFGKNMLALSNALSSLPLEACRRRGARRGRGTCCRTPGHTLGGSRVPRPHARGPRPRGTRAAARGRRPHVQRGPRRRDARPTTTSRAPATPSARSRTDISAAGVRTMLDAAGRADRLRAVLPQRREPRRHRPAPDRAGRPRARRPGAHRAARPPDAQRRPVARTLRAARGRTAASPRGRAR